ncbi:MAG: hypothetical protein JST51_11350 [Armatimonadetes bacterium]|nr:hypothetical protein [Armatimonadota bacterium]
MTLGRALMVVSFLLPFVLNFGNSYGRVAYVVMVATLLILAIGYGLTVWEDLRDHRRFSYGRLFYALAMALVYLVLTPILMAAAQAAIKVGSHQ